ncbi:MAG: 2-oxo acid dehydrogenase subunit E2 [Lentisphaerae bacterium]|nr:dihydrolipoamide acetyltransferase family protein [Victivallaceae bacterium]MDD3703681.1 dihydrolipoamide acetyltransferase family protein [Victivallaceae bacterium]NLK83285.1 2-oxo acid dehydrogenase subunit E2 [Lentisphaerota bacterium]
MATKIPIPKLGQSEETVTIASWQVKEGAQIKKGDVLFEVETDKAVLEVESQFEGTILKVVTPAGVEVPVMTTAAIIGEPGEKIPDDMLAAPAPPKAPEPAKPAAAPAPPPTAKTATPAAKPVQTPVQAPAPAAKPAAATTPVRKIVSPRARKFAANYLVNLNNISGTGGGVGRVTEQDVKNYLETSGYHDKKITPVAFELAKKEQLELLAIEGTGDNGRITIQDVKDAAAEKPQVMNTMRKIIAQRLQQSKQTIPHFYVTVAIDMGVIMAKRKLLKDEGINLSVNAFIVKAAALSLRELPMVNAITDGNSVIRRSKINVGVAVSVPNGLLVPVIRNTDRKGLDEIQAETAEYAEKARAGKIAPDQLKGGTFTISNMGMMNLENFIAIVNPGESAILAVSSSVPTPVVRDGEIVVRDIMKVTLSCDHRIIDGALGAEFVNALKKKLEDAALWDGLI